MFIDIDKLYDEKESDLTFRSDQLRKAENLLRRQIGRLYYCPDFGVDLAYYLESDISFQNEVLAAHFSERMSMNYLVVTDYTSEIDKFFTVHNIKLSNS